MSNLLGNILIKLGFDGAGFFSGMSKAEAVAKSTGKEIESSLRGVGSAAEVALAPFGEFGQVVGAAFDKMGSSAASALESITKFAGGGGLGLVAGAAAGAAAAVVAADAAFIGIAVHAAENANKIYEMSQKTGVAVETLSGFAAVGRIFGVNADSMAKALEKMGKSAFAAGTAADDSKTAYGRLGIAVKDANGQLRPTSDLLLDVADKFSDMPDGVAKTALAMQIFGKAGADMIPFLNEGKEGIKDYTEAAEKMGAVLTEKSAAAAHQFTKDLSLMQLGVTGVENKIMDALVPTLTVLTDQFVGALEEPDSAFNTLLTIITNITKAIITVGETVWAVFQQIGAIIGTEMAMWVTAGETMANVSQKLLHLDFKGAEAAAAEGMRAVVAEVKQGAEQSAKVWTDYGTTVGKVWNPPPPPEPKKRPHDADDGSAETLRQQEAAEKQALEITLARYKEQLAAAHLYYEQGIIDSQQLVDAETTATNLSYQAHVNYFEKLKKLYSNDPIKLQAVAADEQKFKLEELAKNTESLANATKKFNEESLKAIEQSKKMFDKEQAEDLKRIDKATLDYVASLRALAAAEQAEEKAKGKGDYLDQVEAIQAAMEEGVKSKRAGWKEIEALDRQEEEKELAEAKAHQADLVKAVQQAQTALTVAQSSGDQTRVLEAKAQMNQLKAAYAQSSAEIQQILNTFGKKISADQAKQMQDMMKVIDKFNSQFTSAFHGIITGTQSVGQAFKKMFLGIITDLADFVVQWILKKTEMWIMDKVLSTAARATEGPAQVASAAAVGTANAIASFAAAPWPVDMGAPAFGASIGAAIAALAPAAAAEKGGIVDGSFGQAVPILAHGKEMILPADISTGLQTMIKGNRFPASRSFGSGILPHLAAASNAAQHHYYIDARGTDASVVGRIERAMKGMEDRSVARSISAVNDRAGRRA
jgi:hypothetical protein